MKIPFFDNGNRPIVDESNAVLSRTYFNLVRLAAGGECALRPGAYETACVVMSGKCDIRVNEVLFEAIGRRKDIWEGPADSVYAPAGSTISLRALQDGTEVAIAGGKTEEVFAPFRVTPEDVRTVTVGSSETKSLRYIQHILGQNGAGRCARLLVSELYAGEGCWSGYPPHKHDEDREGEETAHEELYHFRFRPQTGFGAQFCYTEEGAAECVMTRHGDTCLIARGYHPTVTSPGHDEYILAVLVGKTHRGLIQYFQPAHRHLMRRFPGLSNMREAFK